MIHYPVILEIIEAVKSQFYNLQKTIFNSSAVFACDNDSAQYSNGFKFLNCFLLLVFIEFFIFNFKTYL